MACILACLWRSALGLALALSLGFSTSMGESEGLNFLDGLFHLGFVWSLGYLLLFSLLCPYLVPSSISSKLKLNEWEVRTWWVVEDSNIVTRVACYLYTMMKFFGPHYRVVMGKCYNIYAHITYQNQCKSQNWKVYATTLQTNQSLTLKSHNFLISTSMLKARNANLPYVQLLNGIHGYWFDKQPHM